MGTGSDLSDVWGQLKLSQGHSAVPKMERHTQGTNEWDKGLLGTPGSTCLCQSCNPTRHVPQAQAHASHITPCPLTGDQRGGVERECQKLPPLLSITFASCPHAASGESTDQKRHILPKKREGQAQEVGCTHSTILGKGCFRETCSPPATAGRGRLVQAGVRSRAPEYQGEL